MTRLPAGSAHLAPGAAHGSPGLAERTGDPIYAHRLLGEWRRAWREARRIVLMLDFDGTLAPIASRPEAARMLPRARSALARLAGDATVHLAVVSGRALADVRALVGLPEIAYAGNHGLELAWNGREEIHPAADAARPALQRALGRLTAELASVEGVQVEDKGLTLSVHYRRAAPAAEPFVRGVVRRSVDSGTGLRITEGKKVVEVRPSVAWDKGRAVEFLRARFAPPPLAPILYLGDDATDEDAFLAVARHPGGAGILVAKELPPTTAAHAHLRSPADTARFLHTLAEPSDPLA